MIICSSGSSPPGFCSHCLLRPGGQPECADRLIFTSLLAKVPSDVIFSKYPLWLRQPSLVPCSLNHVIFTQIKMILSPSEGYKAKWNMSVCLYAFMAPPLPNLCSFRILVLFTQDTPSLNSDVPLFFLPPVFFSLLTILYHQTLFCLVIQYGSKVIK